MKRFMNLVYLMNFVQNIITSIMILHTTHNNLQAILRVELILFFIITTNIQVIKNYLVLLLNSAWWINFEIFLLNSLLNLNLKLNRMRVVLTWPSQIDRSKDNLINWQENIRRKNDKINRKKISQSNSLPNRV